MGLTARELSADAGHRVWTCAYADFHRAIMTRFHLYSPPKTTQGRALPTIPAPFPFTAPVNTSMAKARAH